MHRAIYRSFKLPNVTVILDISSRKVTKQRNGTVGTGPYGTTTTGVSRIFAGYNFGVLLLGFNVNRECAVHVRDL